MIPLAYMAGGQGAELNMKRRTRVLSTALAVVLASSLCGVPAYALEEGEDAASEAPLVAPVEIAPAASNAPSVETVPGEPAQVAPLSNEEPSNVTPTGSVVVSVTEGRPEAQSVSYTLTLRAADGTVVGKETLELSATDAKGTVRFEDLVEGTYTVLASAPGLATFQQQIEVDGTVNSLELFAGDFIVEEGAIQPGRFVLGDVDDNGVVDNDDATLIVDALEAGAAAADNPTCDIDADGEITLADLQLVADNIGSVQIKAPVTISVPAEAVQAQVVGEGVTTFGDLSSLVDSTKDESVKFESAKPISESDPVEVSFDLPTKPELGGMTLVSPETNVIQNGSVTVSFADGDAIEIRLGDDPSFARFFRSSDPAPTATVEPDGTIVVNFGKQKAVKKVTLTITKTAASTNLAEISRVEFLNDMESRIPEPNMNIPSNLKAIAASKSFTASWDAQPNVTAYEVSITANDTEEIKRTTETTLLMSSFGGKKIQNGTHFFVKVQSVNGTWKSGWSESVEVIPEASKRPDAPESLSVTGTYQGLKASWKRMEDTDTYNFYYRIKSSDDKAPYTKVEGLTSPSYQVSGLADDTEYQVYVTGVNEIGEGPRSQIAVAATASVKPAQLPEYHLANGRSDDDTFLAHVTSATYWRGAMVGSPLDEASGVQKSALGLFDNDYASYLEVKDWDEGAYYPDGNKGVSVTFDAPQTIGMISFAEVQDGNGGFGKVNVQYRTDAGTWQTAASTLQMRKSENGRMYALVTLNEPVTATTFKIGAGRPDGRAASVIIAELRFHTYDGIEDDIMALFADDLHLSLVDGVTKESLDALQARLDAPDEVSGEFHPKRTALQNELDLARSLFEAGTIDGTLVVHNTISAALDNRNLGIGGLNPWQPLGAVAAAGDEIVVYVGAPGKKTGADAPLKLWVAQQHPESSSVAKAATSLKVGRNVITVPSLTSSDLERGGQLYVAFTGTGNDTWSVRVSGAQSVPTLDLYQVSDPAERLVRTTAYIEQLEAFVPALAEQHKQTHEGGDNPNVRYAYDEKNCIANATDILLDQMMYSVPASQILAAAGDGSTADRATKLLASLDGMDQMMELFYQHKGLASSFADGTDAAVVSKNTVPAQHLNIRYTRMFAGAFMYAAGNHIGIEWSSVPGLGQASPIELDDNGAKVSGKFFGWGIAHEIGHNINQSQYAYAEVTNNYFAQLAQTDETSATTRFKYPDVYDRVTSGEMGRAGNVFVQLAMYWQLRLAYDNATAYQLFDTYQEMVANRLFARIDSYARAPQTAPAPGGVALTLGKNESQNIMRLASAAAERDLTDFFNRWGITSDQETAAYVSQFKAEDRAVYYVNDDARAYARTHTDTGVVAGKDVVTATAKADSSQVTLTLGADASAGDTVLGYEITRLTVEGGQTQREVVGFTTDGTYVDNASHLGNRTVAYEVCAVDKFLNRSAVYTVDALKLDGDGLQDKTGWMVTSTMASADDVVPPTTDGDPDAPAPELASARVVDGDANTVFTGASTGQEPRITIDMGTVREVTAVRYTLPEGAGTPIGKYRIEISTDGTTYKTIKNGTFKLENGTQTLYFDNGSDPWIQTYDARYLRIAAPEQKGKTLSVGEIDVFGPSGDNVNFLTAGESAAIGTLKADFTYQQASDGQEALFIPQGSVVFTGSYKGNPAYNVVVLYDAEGNVVGGTNTEGSLVAHQIILAPEPGNALLGETSEGRWVYWIEPQDMTDDQLPITVRAELYRVDNAQTNVGQRLTSDSLPVQVPETLPEIELHQ